MAVGSGGDQPDLAYVLYPPESLNVEGAVADDIVAVHGHRGNGMPEVEALRSFAHRLQVAHLMPEEQPVFRAQAHEKRVQAVGIISGQRAKHSP